MVATIRKSQGTPGRATRRAGSRDRSVVRSVMAGRPLGGESESSSGHRHHFDTARRPSDCSLWLDGPPVGGSADAHQPGPRCRVGQASRLSVELPNAIGPSPSSIIRWPSQLGIKGIAGLHRSGGPDKPSPTPAISERRPSLVRVSWVQKRNDRVATNTVHQSVGHRGGVQRLWVRPPSTM